eukprot:CAMPEP_0185205628 /NCGR_PEP_ID=MMETSP1140-20130426/56942_1 /TAXON_ID=298111 /ORGANISM="Pavlova sp., Strain CCMP459" /LENGTH=69 /DNA_ID=CAMNT_0027773229 /DNA_START=21 /DNA_END=226 /DNA_ORIENTATION=-
MVGRLESLAEDWQRMKLHVPWWPPLKPEAGKDAHPLSDRNSPLPHRKAMSAVLKQMSLESFDQLVGARG